MTSFTIDSRGAATLFLRFRIGGDTTADDVTALTELIESFATKAYDIGYETGLAAGITEALEKAQT